MPAPVRDARDLVELFLPIQPVKIGGETTQEAAVAIRNQREGRTPGNCVLTRAPPAARSRRASPPR